MLTQMLTAEQRALLTLRLRRQRASGGLVPQSRPAHVPLSYAQQRLFVEEQLAPQSGRYNIAGGLRLRGTLNPALVAASLSAIVARHEVLRTTIERVDSTSAGDVDGEPIEAAAQIVGPPAPIACPVVRVRGAAEMLACLEADARTGF